MSVLHEYYSRRAAEYEEIYHKPERQQDLATLKELLRRLLHRHNILEIACGTGYWTEVVAPVARSILATDVSEEVLALAQHKSYPPDRVRFEIMDAYRPGQAAGEFTAALAAFWWSHVPHQKIQGFLRALHGRLGEGATVVVVDNRYVDGHSTPISERDERGNTYQTRRLKDGSSFRVLKNFHSPAELAATLRTCSHGLSICELEYYWCASYQVVNKPGSPE